MGTEMVWLSTFLKTYSFVFRRRKVWNDKGEYMMTEF